MSLTATNGSRVKNEPLRAKMSRPSTISHKSGNQVINTRPAHNSSRKQYYPQSLDLKTVTAHAEDEELSAQSDSDDEMMMSPLIMSHRQQVGMTQCDQCDRRNTDPEFNLVSIQHRMSKQFCSQACQDLFKTELLSDMTCEWCKKRLPASFSMIVMEPSIQSIPVQFCSHKCVNKYKMNVFCTEVSEQLQRISEENIQINNVIVDKSGKERKLLITPELWSKGEQAVVFVNDSVSQNEREVKSGVQSRSSDRVSDRKRRGHSMESVISKISRHHQHMPPEEKERKNDSTESVKLSPHSIKTIQEPQESRENTRTQTLNQQSTEQLNQKFIPIPILIPIPVPFPIPISIPLRQQPTTSNSQPSADNSRHKTSSRSTGALGQHGFTTEEPE